MLKWLENQTNDWIYNKLKYDYGELSSRPSVKNNIITELIIANINNFRKYLQYQMITVLIIKLFIVNHIVCERGYEIRYLQKKYSINFAKLYMEYFFWIVKIKIKIKLVAKVYI